MASYWQRRRERADARLARAERDVAKRAARYYRDELRRLEEALAAFYAEVPADEVSAYRAALAAMDPDAERLLWEDCDEFARAHPERAWMVPVRKRLYRLTRLEGLQASARLGLARATARVDEGLPGHFESVAGESARAVSDALGHDVYDDATVRAFVGAPWSDGRNYSDAIWASADRLAEHVSGDLARGLARGDSYQRLCADMARRFAGQAVSDCMRVVQTEGTYVSRKVQGDAMRRAGFDRYYVDARGDERTCDTCRAVSAQSHRAPLAFDDARPGENYPPLHPRCRCDVNPAVDDWADWLRAHGDAGKAAAERFGAGRDALLGKRGGAVAGLPAPTLVEGERYDPTSRKDVARFIRKYAAAVERLEVEHCYILDGRGRVWHGVGNRVSVSLEGVELSGAHVLHNHPVEDAERVSFGSDDFDALRNYPEMARLYAVNDWYVYEARANDAIADASYNDAMKGVDMERLFDGEEMQHLIMEWLAENGFIDYRRTDIRAYVGAEEVD